VGLKAPNIVLLFEVGRMQKLKNYHAKNLQMRDQSQHASVDLPRIPPQTSTAQNSTKQQRCRITSPLSARKITPSSNMSLVPQSKAEMALRGSQSRHGI
jgi:hypothetical protein